MLTNIEEEEVEAAVVAAETKTDDGRRERRPKTASDRRARSIRLGRCTARPAAHGALSSLRARMVVDVAVAVVRVCVEHSGVRWWVETVPRCLAVGAQRRLLLPLGAASDSRRRASGGTRAQARRRAPSQCRGHAFDLGRHVVGRLTQKPSCHAVAPRCGDEEGASRPGLTSETIGPKHVDRKRERRSTTRYSLALCIARLFKFVIAFLRRSDVHELPCCACLAVDGCRRRLVAGGWPCAGKDLRSAVCEARGADRCSADADKEARRGGDAAAVGAEHAWRLQ